MTSIHNATLSPLNRQSEVPSDSIIRQVASPSAFRDPQLVNPNTIFAQPLASFSAQPQLVQTTQTAQFIGGGSSKGINAQGIHPQVLASEAMRQSKAQNMGQVISADLPPLPPIRRVEYVPYE